MRSKLRRRLSGVNLRRCGQREGGGRRGLGFFVAAEERRGHPSPRSVLGGREIQTGSAGSDPRARQTLPPRWDCGGKRIFSYGEISRPDLTSKPTNGGAGAAQIPTDLPRVHLRRPSRGRHIQRAFQLTLSLCPRSDFLKRKVKESKGAVGCARGSARLTPTPKFKPSPSMGEAPGEPGSPLRPQIFPLGRLRGKKNPTLKREGKG